MSKLYRIPHVAAPALAGAALRVFVSNAEPPKKAVALVAFGGALLIASLVCLGGMVLIDATLRPQMPPPKTMDPGGQAAADRLVGRWVSPMGMDILFSASGVVWLGSNDRIGSTVLAQDRDYELTVSDGSFSCSYRIEFRGDDEAEWNLMKRSPGMTCPSGHFIRPFAFY